MMATMEDDLDDMLAAIPTHLGEGNYPKLKKKASARRRRVESEIAGIRGKLHLALTGIYGMQTHINCLEKQLAKVDSNKKPQDVAQDDVEAMAVSENEGAKKDSENKGAKKGVNLAEALALVSKEDMAMLSQSLTQDDMEMSQVDLFDSDNKQDSALEKAEKGAADAVPEEETTMDDAQFDQKKEEETKE
jgi:hypothetical protein